ncbi:MAG: 3-deoxy-D-manno-octulosonic acid transferase [Phenylobacterium sp.]|uniref:3-deoxy-D-manno-octulosonic acid transferase n=1 Tax=Phenylobacterium sp. TaxID=1871053 RepID=UPI0025E15D76|nr:glycosyltransferase N-terminal domain-containing protein [Phenylobacterium sp.]MCA3740680.1 3-deoxy-D-manno-octulosonic acid transferase [Phenylobacterium sp.]MCA3746856.1 3-deoxy-D-manno-octulosonic acid transferase [Phenylobacterium sp.]MCA3752606.1 3-deoxy-D-manno-octulosonic acid transferase [Phenylobacterium sp.]MCA6229906.1 3-deoxy-D-manno-octulosonic acid transferase [Phenylobacterium sp.]MCA6240402.1 3-deoxy-D-manno-octulosonic acid transferase [Phenylobacterium sp.]
MTLPLALYGLATGLAEPLAPLILKRRAKAGREDPLRLGERLGRAGAPRPPGPLVWLHGVSVGETVSLLALVEGLRARRPDLGLLVTSGTRTSAELLARRLPAGVRHQYVPVDTPGAVRRFLDHWRPDLGVFAESELWPNLILTARRRGTRLVLASARITEGTARTWRRAPASARRLLSAFDLILPQDRATADRLRGLGADCGRELNLKRAGAPLIFDPAELARLQGLAAGRPVALAASTHPGEDALIAEAAEGLGALVVIAPRHPERGAEIAAALKAPRRALGEEPGPETLVWIADTLGEMGLFFRLADVVVMGGSFPGGIGGHNPLEPARLGAPVITGPDIANAADVYGEMFDEVCALMARDGPDLRRKLAGLLADPVLRRRMREAALAYAARQEQTLADALEDLAPLLPAREVSK